eukprot:1791208-Rhodomonas_salina.4
MPVSECAVGVGAGGGTAGRPAAARTPRTARGAHSSCRRTACGSQRPPARTCRTSLRARAITPTSRLLPRTTQYPHGS